MASTNVAARLQLFALAVASPQFASAAADHWIVTESKDAITDEATRTAMVSNKDAFKFSVHTVAPNNIWADFSIPSTDPALLDAQCLIAYRVDDYPPARLRLGTPPKNSDRKKGRIESR